MNRKLQINIILVFVLIGSLFYIFNEVKNVRSNGIDEEKVNLAMRQTAHNMLIAIKDSTSKIDKVERLKNNAFKVEINSGINYDTLPTILEQSLADFNIKNDYYLTVQECFEQGILLGFQKQAVINDEIPCRKRDIEKTCNVIILNLEEENYAMNSSGLFISFLLSLLASLLLWIRRPRKKKSLEIISEEIIDDPSYQLGLYKFDPETQSLQVNEEITSLTYRENKLLQFLARHLNDVCNRESILKNVWEDEGVIVGRSLDVFISRLRKKLSADPNIEIKNIHGVGYKLQLIK